MNAAGVKDAAAIGGQLSDSGHAGPLADPEAIGRGAARRDSLSLAAYLLPAIWILVEAAALVAAFWMAGSSSPKNPADAHTASMALGLASVPATLVLSLIWLLCGPRDRRAQWAAAAMGLFACAVWAGVDQAAASALGQDLALLFPSFGRLGVAVTRAPLLLVWWLWGAAVVVFFYRFFCRGQITRYAATDDGPLRSSQLMGITLLVSITAAGSRWWARMLPVDWPELVLTTAVVFGFGVCAGLCLLCLTVGLLQSPWRGSGGLLLALVVSAIYTGGMKVAFEKTITTDWVFVLLIGLAAGLIHYAIFLLPLRAAGYRLRSAGQQGT